MTEPNKAVQEEELEALRAIFSDDWHDIPIKKTAWGTASEAGWWEVQLRATDDPRVSVKLKGRMVKNYPDQPPPLSLIEPVKLTAAHVKTLSKLIQEKAKASAGAPMIFDVADMVREWISVNHILLPKPGEPEPTLMEEMAIREEAQKAAEAAQVEADRQHRRALAAEQDRLLNEKIILDASRREEKARQAMLEAQQKQRDENVATLADGELEKRELILDSPISVEGHEGEWAAWTCFGGRRDAMWTSYTAEPITTGSTAGFVTASPPSVTVQVIDFSKNYYLGTHGQKRIDSVVTEITRVKGVVSEHVARIYAVQRTKSPKGWERLIVVVERVEEGGKLRTWLPKNGFGEETAKEYITQILSGLADLHRNHHSQKQLDTDLVLISSRNPGEVCLKMFGTGYARRIAEYHRSNPFLKTLPDAYPDSWLSPDEIDSPTSASPKRDIWQAGLLLLQFLFGKDCLWTYPDLRTLLEHAPGGVSPLITTLLSGLLNPSPKKRLSAEEALVKIRSEEESTRRPLRAIPSHMSLPGSATASASSSIHQSLGTSPVFGQGFSSYIPAFPVRPEASRYRTDFEEVEFLGKGGFGEVVKARNKLDGRPYAIKKVKLRPEEDFGRVLREVQSLSRVSHQHIVRYYGCWRETVGQAAVAPSPGGVDSTGTPSAVTSSNVSSASEPGDPLAINWDESRNNRSRSQSFPRIRFSANDEEDSEDEDDDVTDESNGTGQFGQFTRMRDDSDDSDSDESDTTNDSESSGDSEDSAGSARTVGDPSQSLKRGRPPTKAIPKPIPVVSGSKPSASFATTTTDDGSVQEILYIQMEFVEKQTLREAITEGLSEEETWRLLKQILQALAHMSSLGIVHRDLKPSNILLDTTGNVKIADFGLATTDTSSENPTGSVQASTEVSDRTSNIGTSLYIAPEVLSTREVVSTKSYDEKADMYSLGIIFFEMCFPFSTGMERVQTITELRKSSWAFPVAWPPTLMPKQREIISLLLRHDPAHRPKATQLLDGPLVPSSDKEDAVYREVIGEVTNPRSEKYSQLVDSLFESHANSFRIDTRLDDYTYDTEDNDGLHVWITGTVRRIADLFQRHGAVHDALPLLIPETTLLSSFPDLNPARFLDPNGKFVQLPSSNLLAMARNASRRSIERIKRYHVGQRYRETAAGGQPSSSTELCFDIISPLRSQCAEAELLDVVDKVIVECQGGKAASLHDYEIHVSHESVLATILASAPVSVRSRVLKAFKTPTTGVSFGSARASPFGTIPGLPRNIANDLEQISAPGEFLAVRKKIEATFSASRRKLSAALDEIAEIIKLARACGVNRKILFRPTLSRNAEYFRGGFMFEVVRRGKHGEVVAYGGRYDSLLEHFKEPAMHSNKVYGAGMSVAVDPLAKIVRKQESALAERLMVKANEDERSFGLFSPTRCDVYVTATGQADLEVRLGIVGELWRAGVRADLQYDDGRPLEDVTQECLDQNILFLVIARARPTMKVRNVLRRSEEEVPRNELTSWLRNAISEQRKVDASYAVQEGSVAVSKEKDLPIDGSAKPSDVDIKLVLPPDPVITRQTKGKAKRTHRHASKNVYYDKALEFAGSVKSTLPILGVDLHPTDLVCQLAHDTAWVMEDEAWRAKLSALPTSDRKYADSIREAVREYRKTGNLWLFSVRDARGYLMQFTR